MVRLAYNISTEVECALERLGRAKTKPLHRALPPPTPFLTAFRDEVMRQRNFVTGLANVVHPTIQDGLTMTHPFLIRETEDGLSDLLSRIIHIYCVHVVEHTTSRLAKSDNMINIKITYTSRVAFFALDWMKLFLDGTSVPMRMSKILSASRPSSTVTCFKIRTFGSMVVSQSSSAFISPRPL